MVRELCQYSSNEIRTLPKVIGRGEFCDAAAAVCGCQQAKRIVVVGIVLHSVVRLQVPDVIGTVCAVYSKEME